MLFQAVASESGSLPFVQRSTMASGILDDGFGLLIGLNRPRPHTAHLGNGVLGRQSFFHEVTGQDHSRPTQTGAAVNRDAHVLLPSPSDGGEAMFQLGLCRSGHVLDRHVQEQQARLVDPVPAGTILGQRNEQLDSLAAQPEKVFQG